MNQPLPLVPATKEGLAEMRCRVATVAEETMRTRLAGKVGKGKGKSAVGGALATPTGSDQDTAAATASYLRAFQAAIMTKVASACDIQDAQEQREAEDLMKEIVQFNDEMQHTRERLEATRARVATLAATTCNDSLCIDKATDDGIAAALNAKIEQARKDCDAGVPPSAAAGGAGIHDNGLDSSGDSFAGLEQGALEPKVSLLIGKITELPGPLKSVLQEMPELTASLAKTVQSVEAAMGVEESRTESLLAKAPPTPLVKGNGGAGGNDGGYLGSRFPEEVRATAKEARAKQARDELEAGGAGVLGRIFS